ncbi:cycloartenol-c-24-methyltransferase [Quercus suber]|uniref:Cycloartenol-c-24-methyltransferase n=1 Tax=Quercus suber TaxID=58331 RepID=A0AAW0JVP6_QUESU
MSKSGALDLASGVGGKLQKKQVLSTVQRYLPFLVENAYALFLVFIPRVNKYYDLVTSFYEYGWGESFHFAASGASITGINNNEYQITRGKVGYFTGTKSHCRVDETCNYVKHSFNVLLICVKIIWEEDVAVNSPLPWYLPLDKNQFSLASFRVTAFGRFITRNMVKILEFFGLAPEGSQRVQSFLEQAADALVEGGRKGIFSPMYFFLVQKPHS